MVAALAQPEQLSDNAKPIDVDSSEQPVQSAARVGAEPHGLDEIVDHIAYLINEGASSFVLSTWLDNLRAAIRFLQPAPASDGKVDDFNAMWRCSACGDHNKDSINADWRWDGLTWQHKCQGAQMGYWPAVRVDAAPPASDGKGAV